MSNIELDDRGLLLRCPQCGQRNRMTYERLGQTFRCGKCRSELHAPNEPVEVKSESTFDALTRYTNKTRRAQYSRSSSARTLSTPLNWRRN